MVWNEGRATHDSTVNKIRVQEIIITFKVHEKKSMNCIFTDPFNYMGAKYVVGVYILTETEMSFWRNFITGCRESC